MLELFFFNFVASTTVAFYSVVAFVIPLVALLMSMPVI
jgi:hypothetical protein